MSWNIFFKSPFRLSSLSFDGKGNLYSVVPDNGDVICISGSNQHETMVNTNGMPVSISAQHDGEAFYIADLAHQALLKFDKESGLQEYVRESEGQALLGPCSILLTEDNSKIFIDSGPEGSTGLQLDPRGSLFSISTEDDLLRRVLSNCLAAPTSLCATLGQIFVAESANNRIIRVVLEETSISATSWYQFNGFAGVTALAADAESGIVFAGRSSSLQGNGILSVLSADGTDTVCEVELPGPKCYGLACNGDYVYCIAENGVYRLKLGELME